MFRSSEFPITAYLDKLEEDYKRDGYRASFEHYVFNAEFLSLPRRVSVDPIDTPQVIATESDAGFVCFAHAQHCVDTATKNFVAFPQVSIKVRLDGSGRDMQNIRTPLLCVFGRGDRPFELPRPYQVGPKSTFTITAGNFETATDFDLRLSFIGAKIFLERLG